MATPTTVLEFVTFQNTSLNTALVAAKATLTAKQTAYTTALSALAALQLQLAATAADMNAIRTQLAGSVTPEDGAALLASLSTDISTSRRTSGAIANAQLAFTVAKADADAAAAEVQRITAAITALTPALQDAQTQDNRRTALKAAMAAPPLTTIVADSTAVEAGPTFTAAGARLAADLPAPLQAEAVQRLQDETSRANTTATEALEAQDILEAQWTADGGLAGAVLALQGPFQRADAAFTAYISTAADRLAQARAALSNVADPTYSALSPAQKASIVDNSHGVVSNAETAATLEKAVEDANLKVEQMQAALDEARDKAIQNNVDADPSTDPGVVTATANLTGAQTALTTAQTAYTAAQQQQTATWEVLVPDSEWQLLAAFENAKATLDWLKSPGPAALAAAMDAAELALTKALLAADKSMRTLTALKADAVKWATVAQYETTAAGSRQFSALRGDI